MSDLLKKIKLLGAYDNSLIIFTADHGGLTPKDKTYGGLLPLSGLTAGYNPLLMIKPPQANYPFRISNMTTWIGDIAPTIREYLGRPLKGKGRSLLKREEGGRILNSPLYIRPDQVSYTDKLDTWKRIDFVGNFSNLSSVVKKNDLHNMLRTTANIELSAGLDHYLMKIHKSILAIHMQLQRLQLIT